MLASTVQGALSEVSFPDGGDERAGGKADAGAVMVRKMTGGLGAGGQKGATAVEFAFVFPVFFLLFYGLLMYGLIFLMRLGLQHAAEDGARAALRYPATSCAVALGRTCTATEQSQYQFNARLGAAYQVAALQARWMDFQNGNPLTITTRICQVGQDCATAGIALACAEPGCAASMDAVTGTAPVCGADFASSCQIMITVSYDYARVPFIPSLPGFGLLAPDTLIGQARMLLDGRALSS